MFATDAEMMDDFRSRTVGCNCPENAPVWDCCDCPIHGADAIAECEAQSAAEIWAEGAWLRAAEAGNPDTWAEEDREREMELWAGNEWRQTAKGWS